MEQQPDGYVVRVHSDALGGQPEIAGYYLVSYDNDADDGRGTAEWSADAEKALVFDTKLAAFKAWRSPSSVRPMRPDGQPNRPLTAYTVEILAIHDSVPHELKPMTFMSVKSMLGEHVQ